MAGLRRSHRFSSALVASGVAVLFALSIAAVTSCGSSTTRSPFVDREAGAEDAGSTDGGDVPPAPTAEPEAGPPEIPGEWGGPCLDDGNCNDAIDCTEDVCDGERARCHFVAKPERCDDSVFCNGVERCVLAVGCRAGDAEACSDGTTCTIDACDEETRTCSHALRDADGDGDPDGNCPEGGDCNDQDPSISSKRPEICGNGKDDDCDGKRDETDCESPAYDTCEDPLKVTAPGTFSVSAAAARTDYAATCVPAQAPLGDLVFAIRVPDGDPVDVDVGVTSENGDVEFAAFAVCGDASSEIACSPGTPSVRGSRASRLLLRGQPPGTVYVTLFTNAAQKLGVVVDFPPATVPPSNETCSTATPLAPGTHVIAPLVAAKLDLTTSCAAVQGELVYSFTLAEPHDVRISAAALDAFGTPVIALRRAPCDGKTSELACGAVDNAQLYRRALPAGDYFVVVGSTGQGNVDVVVEVTAPTPAPADDGCSTAPLLAPNTEQVVDFTDHEDDIAVTCAPFGADAAYALRLDAPSDVLLVMGIVPGDIGGISLAAADCSPKPLACRSREQTPIRAAARGMAPGDYRVVAESEGGSAVSLAAFVRPATPPVLVPFSDDCDDALEIPETGGTFQGNTSNASDDHSASCDVGNAEGAPDQFLSFHLDRATRVVLDARGSAFSVIVNVRRGDGCPGDEVPFGCSAGYVEDRSFVDVILPAGAYKIQIDGYVGQAGAWTLDAFFVPLAASSP